MSPIAVPRFGGLVEPLFQQETLAIGVDPLAEPRPRPKQDLVDDRDSLVIGGDQTRVDQCVQNVLDTRRVRRLGNQTGTLDLTTGVVRAVAELDHAEPERCGRPPVEPAPTPGKRARLYS